MLHQKQNTRSEMAGGGGGGGGGYLVLVNYQLLLKSRSISPHNYLTL